MSSGESAAPPGAWRQAVLGMLLCVLSGYCAAGLPVFRDALRDHFGLSDRLLGLLFSIGMVPGALAALVAGLAVSRLGTGRLIGPAAVGLTSAYLVAALSPHYSGMLLAGAGAAIASQFVFVAVQAHVVQLFPSHGRRTMCVFLAGTTMGGVIFPVVAEALLQWSRRSPAVSFAWVLHAPFALLAVATAAVAIPLRHQFTRDARSGRRHVAPGGSPLAFTPAGWALVLLMALHMAADNLYVMWLPRILDSASFAARPLAPGPVLAAASLVYVVARILLAFAPEHRGRRSALVAPYLVGGVLLLAAAVTGSQPGTGAAYVFGSLLWSASYPTQLALMAGIERERFAAATATALLAMGLLTTALSCAMGASADALGDARLRVVLLIPVAITLLTGLGNAAWILVAGRRLDWRAPLPQTPAPPDGHPTEAGEAGETGCVCGPKPF